jgi:sulfur-oxidizing protein SoxX
MRSLVLPIVLIVLVCGAAGCAYTPIFGFPIEEGDIDAGRQAFIDHRCHQCHAVDGVRLPELAGAGEPLLVLGGETIYVKSYADLMTSIINPDHRISERYRDQEMRRATIPVDTPMPTPHIETMTVRQLIDIVAFLDSRYQLVEGYDSFD